MSDKEKKETYSLLKNAEQYNEETKAKIFTKEDNDFTDYQFDVAINWLKEQAGIKKI